VMVADKGVVGPSDGVGWAWLSVAGFLALPEALATPYD
jgi:hypothetical protein